MMRANDWVNKRADNTHSQYGEDGILRAILDLIPDCDGWCVEFGAWDGKYLSNTFNLIENNGYKAVLIESNPSKFAQLQKLKVEFPKIHPVKALVGYHTDDSLDVILAQTPIPRDFDLLSIDIDGNDYHVWQAVREFRPKIVCIEFNPSTPNQVEFVQPRDPKLNQGCSVLSLCNLAQKQGYQLVATTFSNAFFVRDDYFPRFEISDNSHEKIRTDTSGVTYIFAGYDGTMFLQGAKQVLWHSLRLHPKQFQVVPRLYRTYPKEMKLMQKIGFTIYRGLYVFRSLFRR